MKIEAKSDEEDADAVWMAGTDENVKVWLAKLNEDEYKYGTSRRVLGRAGRTISSALKLTLTACPTWYQ